MGLHSESLHFALGPLSDLSKVKHFLLTIQPAREQLTAAVQVEGGESTRSKVKDSGTDSTGATGQLSLKQVHNEILTSLIY